MVKVEPTLRDAHQSPQTTQTMNRILDAAEELFADHGIAGTSVRNITVKADVNVAAVNYHFTSKENLVKKVVERRAEALELYRTDELDKVDARARAEGRDPTVHELVDAMISPIMDLALDDRPDWKHFIRFISRLSWEPGFELMEPPESQLRILRRFDEALMKAAPHLAADPLKRIWRIAFMRAATQQALLMLATMRSGKYPDTLPAAKLAAETSSERIKSEFVAFVTAGVAAP